MQFTSHTPLDGVTERLFTLSHPDGDITGVLWTHPDIDLGDPAPLVLMAHGGGQHKKAAGVEQRALRFVTEAGFAVVAVDAPGHGDRSQPAGMDRIRQELRSRQAADGDIAPVVAEMHALLASHSVPELRAVLDAMLELPEVAPGPVGYWGLSMGCGLGLPFLAADPRVGAAVLGLGGGGGSAEHAAQISVPIQFLLQWDDELVPRADGIELFEAFASAEKTLHANPGGHGEVPLFETDSALRFFVRHLGWPPAPANTP